MNRIVLVMRISVNYVNEVIPPCCIADAKKHRERAMPAGDALGRLTQPMPLAGGVGW
ncbi:hypothetical protein [Dechloromonas sp. A34]|uniref:hypothetical protein n=1 Tax=Dechloromonas sp. A34 TaxID=447588 RepID=UPI0022487DEF|nr:hypothetical protein [Dechloromonas sp. A34]